MYFHFVIMHIYSIIIGGINLIILITGASHTGKTLFAQKLLEKYHYPYLSIENGINPN